MDIANNVPFSGEVESDEIFIGGQSQEHAQENPRQVAGPGTSAEGQGLPCRVCFSVPKRKAGAAPRDGHPEREAHSDRAECRFNVETWLAWSTARGGLRDSIAAPVYGSMVGRTPTAWSRGRAVAGSTCASSRYFRREAPTSSRGVAVGDVSSKVFPTSAEESEWCTHEVQADVR